jgi:hypothetical protein
MRKVTHILPIRINSRCSLGAKHLFDLVDLDLSLQSHSQLGCLLPLTVLRLSHSPRLPLLPRLPRHSGRTRAGTNSKALVRQPSLENTADNIKSPRLDNAASDGLAAPDANVDDALEGERKSVRGVFVEGLGVKGWDKFRGAGVGRGQAVQDGGIVWRGRTDAEVMENADKAFEATIHCHYFADPGRGRSQICQMCQRVEQWQGGSCIQSWKSNKLS